MPITRLEHDKNGSTTVYFTRREETPPLVWALRAIAVILAITSVFNLIGAYAKARQAREFATVTQSQLHAQTSWDFDITVDGRYRYCDANPDECMRPWGTNTIDECVECVSDGEYESLEALIEEFELPPGMNDPISVMNALQMSVDLEPGCACRTLYTAYGWDDISGVSLSYDELVGPTCGPGGCNEPTFRISDVCQRCDEEMSEEDIEATWGEYGDPGFTHYECNRSRVTVEVYDSESGETTRQRRDIPCIEYPLYGEYSENVPAFFGKEVVKALTITLVLVVLLLGGAMLFIVVRYAYVSWMLIAGMPNAHKQLAKVGALQIVLELAKNWYFGFIAERVYSLTFLASSVSVFTLALAGSALVVSVHPSVRGYFTPTKFAREAPRSSGPAPGSGGGTPRVVGSSGDRAPEPRPPELTPTVRTATPTGPAKHSPGPSGPEERRPQDVPTVRSGPMVSAPNPDISGTFRNPPNDPNAVTRSWGGIGNEDDE